MTFIKQHGLLILAFGMLGMYVGHLYETRKHLLRVNACMAGEVSKEVYDICVDKTEAR